MKNKKYNVALQKIEGYKNTYIPQANNLSKVALVIKVLKHSFINEKDIALALSFSDRQALYYADALRFLELVNSFKYGNSTMVGLTEEAIIYFGKGNVEANLRKYIYENMFIEKYERKLKKEIGNIDSSFDEATIKRRTASLNAWKRWINE